MRVRSAADADLPAIAAIAVANDDPDGTDPAYVSHLRDNGRFLVAEVTGAGGVLAGYCGIRRTGEYTMLTDLFVDPERHGGGTGRMLLESALDGPGERLTFASRDPRALSLYARFGMVPRWPLLYLSGPPVAFGAPAADRVPLGEAAAAEMELTGRDRGSDYAYWSTRPDAAGVIVRDGRSVVSAGAVGAGRVFHLVTAQGHDPTATLAAAMGTVDGDRVRLCLPGPHPALAVLLEAGWRIEDLDQYMSSRSGLLGPGSVLSPSLA